MKNKKYIIIGIILIIAVLVIGLIMFFNKKNTDNNENVNNIENVSNTNVEENIGNNTNENTSTENIEKIENMKKEINATGNSDIYYIDEEYDGRKILQIKPEIQFDVDLAGIIKNAKPEENELNDLIGRAPQNNGVWISEQSREKFSELLRNNNIENFSISDEGYLKIDNPSNDLANKINNMINSDKLYIINITGTAYERDYISGEITEYPFEDMDPYQIVNSYQKDNKVILEMTTNRIGRLGEDEIIDAITNY